MDVGGILARFAASVLVADGLWPHILLTVVAAVLLTAVVAWDIYMARR